MNPLARLAKVALLRLRPAWENDTIACAAVTGPIPRISAWRTACYRLASRGNRRRAKLVRGGVGEPRSDQVLQRPGRGLLLAPLRQLG